MVDVNKLIAQADAYDEKKGVKPSSTQTKTSTASTAQKTSGGVDVAKLIAQADAYDAKQKQTNADAAHAAALAEERANERDKRNGRGSVALPGASIQNAMQNKVASDVDAEHAAALATERADERDKMLTPSVSRQAKYGIGNIDLTNRPIYKNDDGSISTVRSMSFGEDGKEILVPTIAFDKNGNPTLLTNQQAIDRYHQTGEFLGKFDTIEQANKYAQDLHKQQENYYSPKSAPNTPVAKGSFTGNRETPDPTLTERLVNIILGAGKSTASAVTNGANVFEQLTAATAGKLNSILPENMQRKEFEQGSYDLAEKYGSKADKLAEASQRNVQEAQQGLGFGGKLLVNAGVAGAQMLGDAATNLIFPGAGLASMGVRAFGSGAQEARQNGATLGQQIGYGAATAGVEVLTEKMFDGLAGIYGGGAADDIVSEFISNHTNTMAMGRLLSYAASALGESVEEIVAGLAEPALKTIYNKKSYGENFDPQEVLESAIIGGLLGLIGGNGMYNSVLDADVETLTKESAVAQGAVQAKKGTGSLLSDMRAQGMTVNQSFSNADIAQQNATAASRRIAQAYPQVAPQATETARVDAPSDAGARLAQRAGNLTPQAQNAAEALKTPDTLTQTVTNTVQGNDAIWNAPNAVLRTDGKRAPSDYKFDVVSAGDNGTVVHTFVDSAEEANRLPTVGMSMVVDLSKPNALRNAVSFVEKAAAKQTGAQPQTFTPPTVETTNFVDGKNAAPYNESAQNETGGMANGSVSVPGEIRAGDDFRTVQERSRRESNERSWTERGSADYGGVRKGLPAVLRGELERRGYHSGADNARNLTGKNGERFEVFEVDGQTFRDIFEVARTYTPNGELVDLHGVETTEDGIGYNDCRNFVSSDGTSGFSITPDGDLISVYNLGTQRGWLYAIAPIVNENVKTLDCYVSEKQNLARIYEKVFGMQTASLMENNPDFDHDDINANHGAPKVAFMVNAQNKVPMREFGKDDYDAAKNYQVESVGEAQAKSTPQGVNSEQTQNDSLGSARGGFDPFTEAQNRYGTLPSGENPVRSDDVPVSTNGTDRVSQSVVTAKGAAATPDSFVPIIENDTMNGEFSYIRVRNNETTQAAVKYIQEYGWREARRNWERRVNSGRVSANTTALGALLYNNAVNSGDTQAAREILSLYVGNVHNAAEALQAARILKTLTPESRLYMIDMSVQRFIEEAHIPNGITISQETRDAYTNAATEAERDKAIDRMVREIADQIPSTMLDKLTALRYLNMLGNFKTQVRNIVGNVGMQGVSDVKDVIGAALERIVDPIAHTGRTKSVIVGQDLMNAARADFDGVRDVAMGEARYSRAEGAADASDVMRRAREAANPWKYGDNRVTRRLGIAGKQGLVFKMLQGYQWMTNKAMEGGDVIFAKHKYARALAGWLKANGITAAQFSDDSWRADHSDTVDRARAYAIREAQEATFRDNNTISTWVSRVGRRQDTPRAVRTAAEGVSPFRRTPANVAIRAEEYSPLGLLNAAVMAAEKALSNTTYVNENGSLGAFARAGTEISGVDIVNQLSKTLTGTGLFLLGMGLRNKGLLRGGDDEDENQQYFDELLGHQSYAIELPNGVSYTLDWMTPGAIPLFMGGALQDAIDDGDFQLKDLESSLLQISDPMLEMSMLQGVNDTLESVRYADNSLEQVAKNAFLSFATQGLTNQLAGQIERSGEEVRMTYFVEPNNPLSPTTQKAISKASAKIPGWDYQQIPYIDPWGRTESTGSTKERVVQNLISPGYKSNISVSAVESELQRIADKTGKTSIFPDLAEKSFDVDGETFKMTGEQYVKFAKKLGTERAKLLDTLFSNSGYKALNTEQQLDIISKAYEYASVSAKESVSNYKPGDGSWINNARKSPLPISDYLLLYEKYGGSKYLVGDGYERVKAAESAGMTMDSYIKMKENIDADGNKSVSQAEARAYLDTQTDLTRDQKRQMWNIINESWKKNPY